MNWDKPLISVNRVAVMLKMHHSTARSFLESLNFETVAIGKRILYRSQDVLVKIGSLLAIK